MFKIDWLRIGMPGTGAFQIHAFQIDAMSATADPGRRDRTEVIKHEHLAVAGAVRQFEAGMHVVGGSCARVPQRQPEAEVGCHR